MLENFDAALADEEARGLDVDDEHAARFNNDFGTVVKAACGVDIVVEA